MPLINKNNLYPVFIGIVVTCLLIYGFSEMVTAVREHNNSTAALSPIMQQFDSIEEAGIALYEGQSQAAKNASYDDLSPILKQYVEDI